MERIEQKELRKFNRGAYLLISEQAIHMKTVFLLVIPLILIRLNAQDPFGQRHSVFLSTDQLLIEDFAYPSFFEKEQHSSFKVTYTVSQDFLLELQGFYDTYMTGDRFRMPISAKKYFGNRFYLYSGVEYEFLLGQKPKGQLMSNGEEFPRLKPRLGYISGFGYDVQENFMIEAKSNFLINDSELSTFGQGKGKNVFALGSKIKF